MDSEIETFVTSYSEVFHRAERFTCRVCGDPSCDLWRAQLTQVQHDILADLPRPKFIRWHEVKRADDVSDL